jgi:hypothetical protein
LRHNSQSEEVKAMSGVLNIVLPDTSHEQRPEARYSILLCAKERESLTKAEGLIRDMQSAISREIERHIPLPEEKQEQVLGSNMELWGQLVEACGGPADPALQRDILIEMYVVKLNIVPLILNGPYLRKPLALHLRADFRLLDAIEANIKMVLSRHTSCVYGTSIARHLHGTLRAHLRDRVEQMDAIVLFPDDDNYTACGPPVNYSGKAPETIVKLIGTPAQYQKSRAYLQVSASPSGELDRLMQHYEWYSRLPQSLIPDSVLLKCR